MTTLHRQGGLCRSVKTPQESVHSRNCTTQKARTAFLRHRRPAALDKPFTHLQAAERSTLLRELQPLVSVRNHEIVQISGTQKQELVQYLYKYCLPS